MLSECISPQELPGTLSPMPTHGLNVAHLKPTTHTQTCEIYWGIPCQCHRLIPMGSGTHPNSSWPPACLDGKQFKFSYKAVKVTWLFEAHFKTLQSPWVATLCFTNGLHVLSPAAWKGHCRHTQSSVLESWNLPQCLQGAGAQLCVTALLAQRVSG